MIVVGREAKRRMSELIRRAVAGEEVVIPVAARGDGSC